MVQKSSCCVFCNNYFLFIYTIFVIKLSILRKNSQKSHLKTRNPFLSSFCVFLHFISKIGTLCTDFQFRSGIFNK